MCYSSYNVSHYDPISTSWALLLYALLENIFVDLPTIIVTSMIEIHYDST